jgi:hypothetical protein
MLRGEIVVQRKETKREGVKELNETKHEERSAAIV